MKNSDDEVKDKLKKYLIDLQNNTLSRGNIKIIV